MRNENEKSFAGRLNSTKGYFLGKSKKEEIEMECVIANDESV